jgi:RNA polymerase-binding transcription factor DksA
MERSADPSDQATSIELEHTDDNVSRIRRLVPDPAHRADECKSCGGEVEPPERRALGHDTCITCAERKERTSGR